MPVETTGTVISKETSQKVLSMMESVVSEGTGKNARVAGYRIGGKTGTSEDGVNTNKYVTSFCGVAPIDDPQVVVLVTLYNPTGEGGHQGGGVAAPVGGQIFSEVLPYLEVNQGNEEEVEIKEEVVTPDVLGKTLEEANKILKEQIDFFSEIRHAYHEFNMVEEAIYQVSQDDEKSVSAQGEKIYEILISDDPEIELEKYYDIAPNSFLKEFAGISYLTKEFGDRKIDGASLYLSLIHISEPTRPY